MAKGGLRVGAGRPTASKNTQTMLAEGAVVRTNGQTPLEFMLAIMNDVGADINLRARMAQAAAPFLHPRAGEVPATKKDAVAERAQTVSRGKFAPSAPPRLKII
jgi:hypothetical protein